MKTKNLLILAILQLLFSAVVAQTLKIGEWQSHFNYTSGEKCEEVNNKIYCATTNGLFYVNKADKSIVKLSKIDGFSDIDIQTMEYAPLNDVLMIAYSSTNIDLLQGNIIYPVNDIYRKSMPGKKIINHIYFHNNKAYISGSYGIVVYDLIKKEVKESYTEIGDNGSQIEVFSVAINHDSIYAATVEGILAASLKSPNLLNYKEWGIINSLKCDRITDFQNELFAVLNGYVYQYKSGQWSKFIDSMQGKCVNMQVSNNIMTIDFEKYIFKVNADLTTDVFNISGSRSSFIDQQNVLWFALNLYGLISVDNGSYWFYTPNGPFSGNCWNVLVNNNITYVAPGGYSANGTPTYSSDGFYYYSDGVWNNRNFTNDTAISGIFDIIEVAADPLSKDLYLGSYGYGILVYRNGKIYKKYNASNSSLQGSVDNPEKVNIRCIRFDNKNRLWVSNYGAANPLSVRNTDGTWNSYSLGGSQNRNTTDFVIDEAGRKWILYPYNEGIIVFDETRPDGSQYKKLSKDENNGNLPTDRIHSIALDKKGRIWIGSEEGVAVFYNPENIFSQSGSDANRIWITQNGESGYLLASEIVTTIAVDGSNKKWLGSRNGVWYVNEDGTEIIYHFNAENSPLPSSFIRDIAVNELSGEVFFATDKGLVSFRNTAIEGGTTHGDVYAFPNPVEPGYTGPIAVRGLVYNANVKITDVAGNIVTQLTADGGQAVWDGKDISGNIVKSGVYLVFSSNEDGTETAVTKILIIR